MQTVAISELRANLTEFLKRVETGEELLVTSRGRTVAKIIPAAYIQKSARESLAQLRETATVYDVTSPIEDEWDAAK